MLLYLHSFSVFPACQHVASYEVTEVRNLVSYFVCEVHAGQQTASQVIIKCVPLKFSQLFSKHYRVPSLSALRSHLVIYF